MSRPITGDETREGARYFDSQVLDSSRELSREEAGRRAHHVRAFFDRGQPERAELHGPGGVERVIYYDRSWPDDELAEGHRARYPGIRATVRGSVRRRLDGFDERVEVELDPALERAGHREEILLESGDVLLEKSFDAGGAVVLHRRYEYREDGRLARVLEVLAEGREVVEYEPEDG